MKIALIQLNPVIGDFDGNCRKIAAAADRAHGEGCGLVIFPELAVSGYPPLDLLERRSFLADHDAALNRLVDTLPPVPVMFGCIEQRGERSGKPLYNSVFVARDGAIVHKTRKQLLPDYDVFDENRYFEPGPPGSLFRCGDLNIAVTVCEDIWHYAVDEYRLRPLDHLFGLARESGTQIDLIVKVSA